MVECDKGSTLINGTYRVFEHELTISRNILTYIAQGDRYYGNL